MIAYRFSKPRVAGSSPAERACFSDEKMNNCLGFIGGSGLYELDFLENRKFLDLNSPWGNPSDNIIEGSINGNNIFFLSRHGLGHKLSPSAINYRANIDCFKKCGVTDVISLSAVSSLKESVSPGTFVIN